MRRNRFLRGVLYCTLVLVITFLYRSQIMHQQAHFTMSIVLEYIGLILMMGFLFMFFMPNGKKD
ncbi:hypothetical protein SAMN05421788_110132 [Filimonas lacunae]|uniref:Uncharacterized protein n=1 Tax=Filimonas lacunae TaxID=477680 RepID=A0A1N7R853_9BACT|nr:hypothetical protein [Filimonas lacunae]SIT31310.1 hypothetical protein SAMN05421788_110132 [Filimonas lacunae]